MGALGCDKVVLGVRLVYASAPMKTNFGFDGRMFLTEAEHSTYLRRMPVRYVKHKKSLLCCVCGKPGTKESPIENAHKIGFRDGIVRYWLTPDYLDREENIASAHRGACNSAVEWTHEQVQEFLGKENPAEAG